jgi:hypothetical protein
MPNRTILAASSPQGHSPIHAYARPLMHERSHLIARKAEEGKAVSPASIGSTQPEVAAGGSQSSMRFPSGSITQPNLP